MRRATVSIIMICVTLPLAAGACAFYLAGPTTAAFVLFAAALTTCSAATPVLLGVWTRAARQRLKRIEAPHNIEIIRKP